MSGQGLNRNTRKEHRVRKSRASAAPGNGVRNAILNQLPADEFRRLRDQMNEVNLDFKQSIYEQDGPVKDIYFPNTGIISMVTELSDGGTIETGTVGYEGMAGVPAALGRGRSPGSAFVQIAGRGLRLPASVLAAEQKRGDSPLMKLVHAYLNFVVAMLGQSAACNRMHTVESRMARWLLMTHDRVAADEFPLTQEFLGQMLGVQRPTVNIAGSTLQRAGLIKYARGRITVVDRPGLEASSCECYAHLRTQLAFAMGMAAD
jgi:CRP-like cAMP-binding protein